MPAATRSALLCALLCVAAPLRAEEAETSLGLRIEPGYRRVTGQVLTVLTNPTGAPVDELWLWLPANRLAAPPEGLDERNAHWIYPRAFEPGGTEVEALTVDGAAVDPTALETPDLDRPGLGPGQRVLARVALPASLAPGASVEVSVRFATTVPARFGRFGRARGVLTLAGGFYPQVAALRPEGWDLTGPMADRTLSLLLRAPPGHHVVANGRHVVVPDSGLVELALPRAPYLALVVAPRLHASTVRVRGVTVELLAPRRRYRPPAPARGPRRGGPSPEGVADAMDWDYEGRVLEAAAASAEVFRDLGLGPREGGTVCLVEVPLRLEMVSSVPGAALVSDRVYRVTPLEPFFRFHDLQVARAVAWILLEPAVRREPLEDRAWAQDLLAAAAADAYAEARQGGPGGGLRSLLRYGAFIPEVDMMMYSPLIEFRHLFLRPFRDEDPVRDEPDRLATAWPRGAVLHDRLVDLLGAEATRELLVGYPTHPGGIREQIAEIAREPMGWFFDQWLGLYPSVNYRIAAVDRSRDGAGRFVTRVVVERQGAEIREPVTVRVVDGRGGRHDLRWDGVGQRGAVEVATDAPVRSVEIDPDQRLIEDSSIPGNNARFDDILPSRWRPPVFNGLLFYVSAAEAALYALVDFGLRRQYDARHGLRLRAEYDPRGVRLDVFYQAGLGPLLDLNRASWVLSAGLMALRTVGSFGRDDVGATAFGATLGLWHDTRWYPYDPMHGWGLQLSASASANVTDEGLWGWTAGAGARIAGNWTPRVGHTFTAYGGGGVVFGDPLEEQLPSISDRFALRAFEADETIGRARLFAAVEYRWTVVTDLDVNLFHLARLRTLFFAAFVGGGTVSSPDDLSGLFTVPRLFSEAGGGIRALLEIAGVVPYVVAVDVAYPITPTGRQDCGADGACRPRAPVGVYVSIQQTM